MIRIALGVALAWFVSLSAPAAAKEPSQTAVKLRGQRADLPPRTSPDHRWRYSFHGGHWWYYRDGGRWSYWTGTEWRDYEPKSYGRWYVNQKMAEYNAELARFDAQTMGAYRDSRFQDSLGSPGYLVLRPELAAPPLPRAADMGGGSLEMFTPRPFDGRLNPATSTGGYMGGALRGPFGY